jgi:hypothetical protein
MVAFVLAGAWNDRNAADFEALTTLSGSEVAQLQASAARWVQESDAPLRNTGTTWYLASREDSWSQIAPMLTRNDLESFATVAQSVLAAKDPRFELEADKRWLSVDRPAHSESLRQGLAETLALMGAIPHRLAGGSRTDEWAALIVGDLLQRANADWRIWASLSEQLPLLAEAAPEQFLAAVEQALAGHASVLLNLFQQQDTGFFGTSPHVGVIWGLERLAWFPEHLPLVALILARIAAAAPKQRSNSAQDSLRHTFLVWYPQTMAPWDQQLRVLGMLLERAPEPGWQLHCDILPRSMDSSFNRSKPHWRRRDEIPEEPPPQTGRERFARYESVVNQMLSHVGGDGRRWRDVIDAIPQLPVSMGEAILQRLDSLDMAAVSDENRLELWKALRSVLSHHRSFASADWALSSDRLDRLNTLYLRFEPQTASKRFSWLFANQVHLPEGGENDWRAKDATIDRRRVDAVMTIHEDGGTAAVESLISDVENPFVLGAALAGTGLANNDGDRILIQYLGAEDSAQRQFGRGFLAGRRVNAGEAWVESKFRLQGLSDRQRADVLFALPRDKPDTWKLAAESSEIEEAYWKEVHPYLTGTPADTAYAVRKLAQYGRAYAATELLAFNLPENTPTEESARVYGGVIADTLEALLAQDSIDMPAIQ